MALHRLTVAAAAALLAASPLRGESLYHLDFSPPAPDPVDFYTYSPDEQLAVRDGLAAMYAAFPHMTFMLEEPTEPYSPVRFNTTAIGTSTGIDFRNVADIDVASVNALKGLSFVGVASPSPDEVIKASINLAAHEIGHLEGLRHHDAYTPIGAGMPFTGITEDYTPVFPGPPDATLTYTDVQSLTTAIGGFSYGALTGDLKVGQRSAIKLAYNADPAFFTESLFEPHSSVLTPAPLPLKTIGVPNVTGPGEPIHGLPLIAEIVVISGSIDVVDGLAESDYYSFPAKPGDFIQIEVLSEIIESRFDEFDVAVAVYDADDPLTPVYYGDFTNADERESTDALILDLPAGDTIEIIVEVFPQFPAHDPVGDYELFVAVFRPVPEPASLALGLALLGASTVRRRRPHR